ncbi:hypothetical protein QTI66_32610 [Variovorax sp. J22R133]|uniref:hypothetical protein n=1 Tax=Variovorax brevis TaxID=3053503 RepID=UPI002576E475|nr:hypothetical protein [Variovorax sp. J22R133]MDM0116870.1 hypothetical protein [Variovorax sp. J22R133]
MNDRPNAILEPAELRLLTGYRRASEQLDELRRQGFYRARRSPTTGAIILERPHYEAVCAGGNMPANDAYSRPQVRSAR